MHRLATALATLPLVFFVSGGTAIAYKGAPVANGGTVTGKVTFSGTKPRSKRLKVTKDHGVCGHSKVSEALIVGSGKSIANAVVYIEKISAGKPANKKTAVLDQKGCTYVPHVQATVRGSKIEFRSKDAVLHNVHGALNGKRLLFNIAMPNKGQRIKKKLKKPGVVEVTCDAGHTWMKAYVYVFRHPYFAVTKADGSFTLTDVPAGTYKLVVWHEKLGVKKASITVTAGGTTTSSFSLH